MPVTAIAVTTGILKSLTRNLRLRQGEKEIWHLPALWAPVSDTKEGPAETPPSVLPTWVRSNLAYSHHTSGGHQGCDSEGTRMNGVQTVSWEPHSTSASRAQLPPPHLLSQPVSFQLLPFRETLRCKGGEQSAWRHWRPPWPGRCGGEVASGAACARSLSLPLARAHTRLCTGSSAAASGLQGGEEEGLVLCASLPPPRSASAPPCPTTYLHWPSLQSSQQPSFPSVNLFVCCLEASGLRLRQGASRVRWGKAFLALATRVAEGSWEGPCHRQPWM